MTERQANTLMALSAVLMLMHIPCDGLSIRGQKQTRKPVTGKTVTTKQKGKHSKATRAKVRKIVIPPHRPLIFDPVPIQSQNKR